MVRGGRKRSWGPDYEIKSGRPPLACVEQNMWSYGLWENGTLTNLLRENGTNPKDWAPVVIPEGIKVILEARFQYSMVVKIGKSYGAGILKSAAATLPPDYVLDAASWEAKKDIERIVLAAYLATKNIFRDTGLTGRANSFRALET